MKTTHLRLLALVAGIAIFDFLFYLEAPGLNALLLVPVILTLVRLSGRNPFGNRFLIISSAGLLLAGIAVSLYSSATSILAYFGTFVIFLGFSLEPELKSILATMFQSGLNFFMAIPVFGSELSEILKIKKMAPTAWKVMKLLLIPLILLFLFTTIYRFANPVFDHWFYYLDLFFRSILEWLEKYLEIPHIIFLLFTAGLISGIIYRGRHTTGRMIEEPQTDELTRWRKKRARFGSYTLRMTALKDEYRIGIMLLFLMSGLLFLVNISEIVWISGSYLDRSAHEMSKQVHEGTGLLILSIFLSMVIMLFLFRKNLNFYPGKKKLISGSGIWILLNGILGLQVGIQNWFYISQYGLTYKRIGVFFFLLLVLTGLALLWIKISRKKTIWYLIKSNSWSFYVLFVLLSLIPWESIMVTYNLRKNAPSVDVQNLLELSPRTLYLLDERKELLFKAAPERKESIEKSLNERIEDYMDWNNSLSWQSWSLSDRLAYLHFHK
ncbi:MAG: DUF4173 domain-containing protein [Bacteroidetes bacterium]|nr:DUF4173 domain-containing protein [Bacteroidota bacterium]